MRTSDAKTINRYRFRAECFTDVTSLMEVLGPKLDAIALRHKRILDNHRIPDVDVVIEVEGMSLDELRAAMRSVTDGHVMAGTVQTPDKYTGQRDTSLEF